MTNPEKDFYAIVDGLSPAEEKLSDAVMGRLIYNPLHETSEIRAIYTAQYRDYYYNEQTKRSTCIPADETFMFILPSDQNPSV